MDTKEREIKENEIVEIKALISVLIRAQDNLEDILEIDSSISTTLRLLQSKIDELFSG